MKYIRDKRSPAPLDESTSRVMSANKSKNTSPELMLRKMLISIGLRGYRLHKKDLPGHPDIVFSRKKVAIFVNGCYWHRCPKCNYPNPKHNSEFWKAKFEKNIERDKQKFEVLTLLGWKVVTIWECQVKSDLDKCIELIKDELNI